MNLRIFLNNYPVPFGNIVVYHIHSLDNFNFLETVALAVYCCYETINASCNFYLLTVIKTINSPLSTGVSISVSRVQSDNSESGAYVQAIVIGVPAISPAILAQYCSAVYFVSTVVLFHSSRLRFPFLLPFLLCS